MKVIGKKQNLKDRHIIPEGALSIGEISSRKSGGLEFFNKTIVVGVLYE